MLHFNLIFLLIKEIFKLHYFFLQEKIIKKNELSFVVAYFTINLLWSNYNARNLFIRSTHWYMKRINYFYYTITYINLFVFYLSTYLKADRIICAPDRLNLQCFNEATLKIIIAKSGSQSRDLCSNIGDIQKPIEGSCQEFSKTLGFLKNK